MTGSPLVCALLSALVSAPAGVGTAGQPEPRPGPVVSVTVDPQSFTLDGLRFPQSILVHGKTAGGRTVDLTHDAEFRSLTPETVTVSDAGVVRGIADGAGKIEVEAAGHRFTAEAKVTGADRPHSFHFKNDVEPIFSRYGCNMSACHAKQNGQNGFKLSVFGFNAAADYEALTRASRGRRVFPLAPDHSLMLLKATNTVSHGGGERIRVGSPAYETLRGWIASGMPWGPDDAPHAVELRLTPDERRMAFGSRQQLRVTARYSDGREADVTTLARFQSNHEGLATVDENGLIVAGQAPGQAAVMASFMDKMAICRVIVPRPVEVEPYPDLPENNFIDQLVYRQLGKLNIVPSEPADDAEFLRRVYIDITGTLPTVDEARAFLADTRPDRRRNLVDDLLNRSEYATYSALKWADLLRVDRATLGHEAAYGYYRWLRESFAANKPVDRMARELLLSEGPLQERPQGALFKAVPEPGELASTVSQVFLGVRIECAKCHHHPFDRWSQQDYYGMRAIFEQVALNKSSTGEQVVVEGSPESKHPQTGAPVYAYALGTEMPAKSPVGDRRRILADWMTSPDNPWFARNIANRTWAHFMGRGLCEPVDDVRATNPPSNPELLDALGRFLVEHNYDLHALIRLITRSHTYQLASRPNKTNEQDEQNYSRALLKPMDAEVLLDALTVVTGVGEKFTGVPRGMRAIELWDNNAQHYFLRLFGRPMRLTPCECERSVEPSVAQVLHMLNAPRIHAKLTHEAGNVVEWVTRIDDDEELIETLYLTAYSRYPSAEERDVARAYLRDHKQNRREATVDLTWSLINTAEFAFNH